MAAVGNVPQLVDFTDFEEWTEVLEAWFDSNGIEEGKKRAILLTSIGSKAYHTLRALMQPVKPTEKSYDECISVLKNHFSPKPREIVQRYRFYTCCQQPNESIAQFVAKLRSLSEGCNFKELDNMLRDRLVVGVNEAALQRKLLGELGLTFEKAFSIAIAMEMARKDVEDIKRIGMDRSESSVNQVNYASKFKNRKPIKSADLSDTKVDRDVQLKCWRCGGRHFHSDCPFKEQKCYKCHKIGHIKSRCDAVKQFLQKRRGKTHHLDDKIQYVDEIENDIEELGHLSGIEGRMNYLIRNKPIMLSVLVNDKEMSFEVDTGSPWSIMSKKEFLEIGNLDLLDKTSAKLRTYTGDEVPIIGETKVIVSSKNVTLTLPLLVVREGVSLMGRDWIRELGVLGCDKPEEIHLHNAESAFDYKQGLESLLHKHVKVFDVSKTGKLEGYQAKVYPAVEQPLFYKAAPVPYATRKKLDDSLDELESKGIIESVAYSDYACPIVVVTKPNGTLRLCGNYKLTANKVLKCEQYPIPTLEDLLQDLQGGQQFSKLDLSHAYHQIELDEEARKYTTVNTHRGLYQYKRLPFGIASAPAIFQRTMESLLGDIPMCRPYLDDIIVSGTTPEEHLEVLGKVLNRLEGKGLILQRKKCEFFKDSVEYLGHILDSNGIRPMQQKIEAIQQAPRPQNQKELQAYLGLLGYYRKFMPNLSNKIAPLTKLLQKEYSSQSNKKVKGGNKSKVDPKFIWGNEQEQAFNMSKELLQSESLLVHFDPSKPLILQTDASPYGLGAVISHQVDDESDRPIAFASRTLSGSELNYAQIEKEGLSIIFGLKKFHKYLYGRHFSIITDHKPLISLFGDLKPASAMASARMNRWHMILSAYDFEISHRSGIRHGNADGLSRLPLSKPEDQKDWSFEEIMPDDRGEQINLLSDLDERPVEASEVKSLTNKDPILARVRQYILGGWPEKGTLGEDFSPFYQKRNEVTVEDGIILWGHRVVIPNDEIMRKGLINELHATHPGIVKMKALARSYLWWPAIDKDLEQKCRECIICQEHQKQPHPIPIHPWEFPNGPWIRIHIDYAYIDNQDVLIVVDAYSKWIEAIRVINATASATIVAMRKLFASHGIPETLVSDNGTQFVSEEFSQFLMSNNVEHVQTAPKHPASNGLAERAVQTIKNAVKKLSNGNLEMKLQKVLMRYRITPQATTGKSPSELLYRRRMRSRLDQVRPDLVRKVRMKQSSMQDHINQKRKSRNFHVHDLVLVKNFASGPTWLRGVVGGLLSSSMCEVDLEDGRKVRRHNDHVRIRTIPVLPVASSISVIPNVSVVQNDLVNEPNVSSGIDSTRVELPSSNDDSTESSVSRDMVTDVGSSNSNISRHCDVVPIIQSGSNRPIEVSGITRNSSSQIQPSPSLRVSTRQRKPPVKLKDYVYNIKNV